MEKTYKIKMPARLIVYQIVINVLLVLVAIFSLFPLASLLITSFKSNTQIVNDPFGFIPNPISFESYKFVFENFNWLKYLGNTMLIVAANVIGVPLTAAMAAYAFARFDVKHKKYIFMAMLAMIMVPGTVLQIPTFELFIELGWINTFYPFIIPCFLGGGISNVFLIRQFITTIPDSYFEAAKLDGANELIIFIKVVFPLSLSIIITVAVFSFCGAWNDFFSPLLYLNDESKYTLGYGLYIFFSQCKIGTMRAWNIICAACVFVMIPMFIIFVLAQKYLISEQEAINLYTPEQLAKTSEILNSINLVLPLNKENHFVKFDKNQDSYLLLRERCRQGIIRKLGEKVEKKYIDRINYELNIIHQMGFDDYFLVVQDYVSFAKQNNIAVGPGRGSAAGSLVSYVLDITEVNPLDYDLYFERFLNPQRKTKPDIDIDFMDNRRGEIFDYLFNKYGQDKTAHIVTFQKIKAKTAIRDIGRILDIDLSIINLICKSIPDFSEYDFDGMVEHSKPLLDYKDKYPLLFNLASFMYGLPRQTGTHAAGVVICNQPLSNIIPTTLSAEGINTTQYSMEYIESCGLIKMDILGLVNLSIISDCVDEINKHAQTKFDIRKIPLNDPKVFKLLTNGSTIGIFQLESQGMTNLVRKIKPTSIEDISVCSAIFRPGPKENIPVFLDYKNNPEKVTYPSDKLKPILEPTYGIIVYQEQVLQTLCVVAN